MAWLNPFRKEDENTRHTYGYTFQWTPDHFTPEQMQPLKYSYDVIAEQALNKLDEISPPPNNALPRNQDRTAKTEAGKEKEPDFIPKRDLYALLRDHHEEDEVLDALWKQVNTVPDWVDWDQIARGQDVFYRYGEVALTTLTYQSLLGGMGANRVVETLSRTGGFSTKVARHRMFETTQHILQCTKSLSGIQPGGAGHQSTIRVRFLHAAVRRRIMKLAKARPDYYSVEEFGIPINDLDAIGTIGTFSATLIWLGFPRQGIFLREAEIRDYVALWRLVAWYIGTPQEYFETPEKAKAIIDSMLLFEVNPSETSKVLANNIILALQGQPPAYASRDFLNANARWLNGNELGDDLGLGRPSLYYWALVAGQCMLFMASSYTYRSFEYLDKRKIAALRRLFYKVIIDKERGGLGEETNFDFKYIPDFHTTTDLGEYEKTGLKQQGIERRNLVTLCAVGAMLGIVSYVGIQMSLKVSSALLK